MALPQFQATPENVDRVQNQMQSAWATPLNRLLERPANNSIILTKLSLTSGDNVIPHTLNRALIGWQVIRQRSAATFYDKQDDNRQPTVNLVLHASADVVIDLEVF